MGGPNADHLQYTQATKWFPRNKALTAVAERAVLLTDMVSENLLNVCEIRIYAVSGVVQVSNREAGTYVTIPVDTGIVVPVAKGDVQVWIKHDGTAGEANVAAFGFEK